MTESIVVALISGLVSAFGAVLVFVASERGRKSKIEEANRQQFEATRDSINETLEDHRTEYLNGIKTIRDSINDVEKSVSNMKSEYQRTVAIVDLKIEALEKAQNKHNNLIERMYAVEKETALQTEQIEVANHRISDLEEHNKKHENK